LLTYKNASAATVVYLLNAEQRPVAEDKATDLASEASCTAIVYTHHRQSLSFTNPDMYLTAELVEQKIVKFTNRPSAFK